MNSGLTFSICTNSSTTSRVCGDANAEISCDETLQICSYVNVNVIHPMQGNVQEKVFHTFFQITITVAKNSLFLHL